MKDSGYVWFRFLIQAIFAAGVALVLVVSLPQLFLHLGGSPVSGQKAIRLNGLLDKAELSKGDYQVLFEQTGLGPCAVDDIWRKKEGRKEDILQYQDAFLDQGETYCKSTSIVTRQDQLRKKGSQELPMAAIEDGDIFVSFSSHTFGWRHGHAGIVVDADRGRCLEAVVIGRDSEIENVEHWKKYSSFAILRLKGVPHEKRKEIADYAAGSLCGIPYSLTSGIFNEKAPKDGSTLTAQCAYLIWYAYAHFGFDLDSDGGRLVTVKDLAGSPFLEPVQVFGMDPEDFHI